MTGGRGSVGWLTPGDVVDHVRRVWDRGDPLASVALNDPMVPIRITVKGPTAGARGADYATLRDWLGQWRDVPTGIRVDWVPVRDKTLGKVDLPRVAWIDTVADVGAVLGVTGDVDVFTGLVARTPGEYRTWMAAHPHTVLAMTADWDAVIAVADWIRVNPGSGLYVREIPVPGVHTKLVETYKREIAALLTTGDSRTSGDDEAGTPAGGPRRSWFEDRYGFRVKPLRIRVRFLDPAVPGVPVGCSDVETPVADAARWQVAPDRILIVENEVTFLALPALSGTVAVWGAGNAAPALVHAVPWLTGAGARVEYWGDIDTHGFTILHRVRVAADPVEVVSVLMDEATLLQHRDLWTVEDGPTTGDLPTLTAVEDAVYRNLVTSRWGTGVRLEQERLPWLYVTRTLHPKT